MTRPRRLLRTTLVLGAAALIATGCGGGGDDLGGDPGAVAAPPTDTAAPGTVAGDPGATDPATGQPIDPATGQPAVDPVTGQPVDPALGGGVTDSGTTATVPELVGDDVVGGLVPIDNNKPLFSPGAVKELPKPATEGGLGGGGGLDGPGSTLERPKEKFSGAKIYVDGIVHDVKINGTFPKGNPVFKLLSVTANEIEIDLVAGEFTSSGGTGTFLDKGDLVSMVNASEQVTYRVKYLRAVTASSDISF